MLIEVADDGRKVIFTGALDETAGSLLASLRTRIVLPVVFDLAGITTINSVGVAQWLRFMREIDLAKGVTFVACPPAFVDQMNMMSDFVGRATVQSVGRYFRCVDCSADGVLPMARDAEFGSAGSLGTEHRCPKCSAAVEFEDQDEDFYHFLTRAAACTR